MERASFVPPESTPESRRYFSTAVWINAPWENKTIVSSSTPEKFRLETPWRILSDRKATEKQKKETENEENPLALPA